MQIGWFTIFRSSLLSIILHAAVLFLLIFSFSFHQAPKPVNKNINIVEATKIDEKQLNEELNRLKKEEKTKKEAEQKRIKELEKKAEDAKQKAEQAEKKRIEEEKELIAAKKKKELEQQQRELEQAKLDKIKKEAEELERQKQLEKEKLEEDKKKKEAEEKRRAEEAEKKRVAEAEKKLQDALAAEEAEAQKQVDASLLAKIASDIRNKVSIHFNQVGMQEGLKTTLTVKLLPGGEVISVTVKNTSGNDIFDRRAVNAVQKASPLPVPDDLDTFERLKLRDITFTFEP